METLLKTTPHPYLTTLLFAHRSQVASVFNEVAGLHNLHHLSIARVDRNGRLLILSSTPAIEFCLFESGLWRYDRTFDPDWYQTNGLSDWPALYHKAHQDELYYHKQMKHHYLTTVSMAVRGEHELFIYSMASTLEDAGTQTLFAHQTKDFFKMASFCHRRLAEYFPQGNERLLPPFPV